MKTGMGLSWSTKDMSGRAPSRWHLRLENRRLPSAVPLHPGEASGGCNAGWAWGGALMKTEVGWGWVRAVFDQGAVQVGLRRVARECWQRAEAGSVRAANVTARDECEGL